MVIVKKGKERKTFIWNDRDFPNDVEGGGGADRALSKGRLSLPASSARLKELLMMCQLA
jgi:hypothetical protein